MRRLLLIAALALLAACGKQGASAESTQAEAAKRARENPVYGDQLKSMDKAKATQELVDKQAEETRKKIEEQAK